MHPRAVAGIRSNPNKMAVSAEELTSPRFSGFLLENPQNGCRVLTEETLIQLGYFQSKIYKKTAVSGGLSVSRFFWAFLYSRPTMKAALA